MKYLQGLLAVWYFVIAILYIAGVFHPDKTMIAISFFGTSGFFLYAMLDNLMSN